MRDLEVKEIEEVNGAFGNFVFGAAVGAVGYMVTQAFTGGSITAAGLGGSMVAGAVSSGFSALAGGGRAATAYFSTTGAAAGGATHQAITHGQRVYGAQGTPGQTGQPGNI
ncbi:hypothetical protein ABW636_06110 [Aquimarina sp. 2201CG1-2-11]|uniref:hypothetical protein n=1 Tax=Aquimarina discodermiae TaxID=3231043 RepID=UPI003461A980